MRFERTEIDLFSAMFAAIDGTGIIGLVTVRLDPSNGEKVVSFRAKSGNIPAILAGFVDDGAAIVEVR